MSGQREVLVLLLCGVYCIINLHVLLDGLCQAIMAEGKQHALGVGLTKMSTTDMYVVLVDFSVCVYE